MTRIPGVSDITFSIQQRWLLSSDLSFCCPRLKKDNYCLQTLLNTKKKIRHLTVLPCNEKAIELKNKTTNSIITYCGQCYIPEIFQKFAAAH